MSDLHHYELKTLSVRDVDFGDRARELYDDLDQLSQSIKERGIISPLSVLATPNGRKPYLLLAGGRRLSAMIAVDIKEFPAKIYLSDLSELEQLEIELYENLHRRDLSWAEKVRLTNRIHQLRLGATVRQTAEIIGSTKSQVQRDLELSSGLNEFPELQKAGTETEARNLLQRLRNQQANRKVSERLRDAPVDLQRIANGFIQGDFFERIQEVPSNSVHFCEVDPPYAVNMHKLRRNDGSAFKEHNFESYHEVEASDYPDFLKKVATECFRIMYPESWIILWNGPQWYSVAFESLQSAGFQVSTLPGFWVKLKTPGQSHQPNLRLGSIVEPFLYANKGPARLTTPGRTNVFSFSGVPPQKRIHPTERPIELTQELLSTFTRPDSQICVPFLGSGNTLLAAANLGLTGFGYDLDQEGTFREGFLARLQAGTPPHYRSLSE